MTNAIPTISVVMPVYNGARFLRTAVESILAQSFGDFELIAVDDGSTDASLVLLREMADRDARIRILSRPNTGIVGVLNDGVAAVRGEFIARMDADDVALPGRFERQLAFLRDNPSCVAVGSAVLQIDSDGDPICVQPWAETHEEIERLLLCGWSGLAHPTAFIRTEAMRTAGCYRAEYQWIEDKDLWLRLAEIGRLANLREPLLEYRLHEYSVCSQRSREQARLWDKLLQEAYHRRGMTAAPPKRAATRRTSPSPGRVRAAWVRAAARGGNYGTALKHAKRLINEYPLQLATWVTLLRATASTLRPGRILRRVRRSTCS